MNKIDTHCHLRFWAYEEEIKRRGKDISHAWLSEPDTSAYLQSLITDMDALEIEHQVITCPTFPPSTVDDPEFNRYWVEAGNNFLSEVCQKHPARFSGLISVPLKNIDAAYDELKRASRLKGIVGIVLSSHAGEITLDSPEMMPIYEEASRRKLIILIHPVLPTGIEQTPGYEKLSDLYKFISFLFDTTMAVTRMAYAGVFEKYPNLKVIASHLCGMLPFVYPSVDIMWEKMGIDGLKIPPKVPSTYFKNLYVDTGRPLTSGTLQCAMSLFGEDHILFGSDYPNWKIGKIDGPRRIITEIDDLDIPVKTRQKIFYENAKNLLNQ